MKEHIPEEWKKTKLSDHIDIKHGYAFKGQYFTEEENQNILLTPGNFKIGGGFNDSKFKYYTGELFEEYILKPGDLIITMTDLSKTGDTLGYPALIPRLKHKIFLHNQRLGKVIFKDQSEINKNFLYWLLRTKRYRYEVLASATGTTVKHTSPRRILEYSFCLPPVEEQIKIAHILDSLEEKQLICNRMNKNLESIGQTIFKHWFIDYEFPNEDGKPYKSSGGEMVYSEKLEKEIPLGWTVASLGDVIELCYGKGLSEKKRIKGDIPVYGSNGIVGYHNQRLVSGPGIIVGRKGTIGTIKWSQIDFFPIDTTFYVKLKREDSSLYFTYYLLSTLDLTSLGSDSAVPGLNRNLAYMSKIVIPSEELIAKFEQNIKPLFSKIHRIKLENNSLSSIRDVLLPKLISGEIRVNVPKTECTT